MTSTLDDARGELLACPFCGSEPNTVATEEFGLPPRHMIWCAGDACFGPATTAGNYEDAKVQWNTRAAPGRRDAESVEYGCPCGKGDRPCPGPDGKPLCVVSPPSETGRDQLREALDHMHGARLSSIHAKTEVVRLREALEEIKRAYVEAPGWAAPAPTGELIWKMYSLARAALSPDQGTVAVSSANQLPPSPPAFKAPHLRGERDPSVMPDCAGGETVTSTRHSGGDAQ